MGCRLFKKFYLILLYMFFVQIVGIQFYFKFTPIKDLLFVVLYLYIDVILSLTNIKDDFQHY